MYLCMKKSYFTTNNSAEQQKKDGISRIHKVRTTLASNCPLHLHSKSLFHPPLDGGSLHILPTLFSFITSLDSVT